MTSLILAVSWLTVVPARGPTEVGRRIAGRAIALAPLVGVLLGGAAVGALWLLHPAGAAAGMAAVAVLALASRGMHLDGLADTFDGLGTYGPPERAREVMKSGGAGPFGVAALGFAIGIQALAFAELAASERWLAVGLAVTLGRVAVVTACRRGVHAAPGARFGALVAGTQSPFTALGWSTAAVGVAVIAVPGLPWAGPLVVLAASGVAVLLVRHCVRRIGGLSGDVLGATVELTTTVAALGFALTA